MPGSFLDLSDEIDLSDLSFHSASNRSDNEGGGLSDVETREDPTFSFASGNRSETMENNSETNDDSPVEKLPNRKRKSPPRKNRKHEGNESNFRFKKTPNASGLAGLSQKMTDKSPWTYGLSQIFRDERKGNKLNCLPKGPFQKVNIFTLVF